MSKAEGQFNLPLCYVHTESYILRAFVKHIEAPLVYNSSCGVFLLYCVIFLNFAEFSCFYLSICKFLFKFAC